MEERISLDQVEAAVDGIREKYNAEFYPFEIRQSGGGYQFLTKKDFYKTVAQLNGDKFLKRLSNAALETLAIIAYKQPITKGEVEAIRGVNSDYSIQKLLEKELVVITGRNEELPGKPLVYSTSRSFMDYFGINSTDDLPKIKEVLAEQAVQGTLIEDAINNHVETEDVVSDEAMLDDSGTALIVSDDGQLIEQPLPVNSGDEEVSNSTEADFDTSIEDEEPSVENLNTSDDNDEEKKVKRDEDSQNDQLRDSSSSEPQAE